MVYLKSILVGLLALVVATTMYVGIRVFLMVRRHWGQQAGDLSFDVSTLMRLPYLWIIAAVAFAVGFYWMFRRASL